MPHLEGEHAAFRTAAERRALIGCHIRYLRDCDIDKSGRGYLFPRTDIVIDAKGRELFLENGSTLSASDLREVVVIERDVDLSTS